MSGPTLAVMLLLASGQSASVTPPPVAPTIEAAPATTGQSVPPAPEMAQPAAPADALPAPAPAPAPTPTGNSSAPPSVQSPAEDDSSIVVTGRARLPGDPLEEVNVKSFRITQDVDRAVVGPLAMAYNNVMPSPVRSGLRNFLNNLREPVVFLNYLLQIKPGKAAETFGRFAINTTVGVAGVFDMAKRKPFKLPRRTNGFANTMGYYGVKPGPFFFLPLVGPTTLRDSIGNLLDRLLLPLAVGKPFDQPYYAIPIFVLSSLDDRIEGDEQIRRLRHRSPDPYASVRDFYLLRRRLEIEALHGKRPRHYIPVIKPLPAPFIVPERATASSGSPS
jgi:phospholipid-binding lipoprotein MlaA